METLKEENDRYDHATINVAVRDEQLLCYLSSLGCHLTLSRKQVFLIDPHSIFFALSLIELN